MPKVTLNEIKSLKVEDESTEWVTYESSKKVASCISEGYLYLVRSDLDRGEGYLETYRIDLSSSLNKRANSVSKEDFQEVLNDWYKEYPPCPEMNDTVRNFLLG